MNFPRPNFSHVDPRRAKGRISTFGDLVSGAIEDQGQYQKFGDLLQQNRYEGVLREEAPNHDFTTSQGQRDLLGNLSKQGYGPEAIGLQKQLPDTSRQEELARKQAERDAESQEEKTIRKSFEAWHEGIAIPFLKKKNSKLSPADKNELLSTVPGTLLEHPATRAIFERLREEPAAPAGSRGRSTYSPSGITRNIEEIDAELGEAQESLRVAQEQKPPSGPGNFQATKDWMNQTHQLKNQISKLSQERRRYQSRGPVAPDAGGTGQRQLTDPNKAREYLNKAGGDAHKARGLARKDGWTF